MKKESCACGPANLFWGLVACGVLGVGALLFVNALSLQWGEGMTVLVWGWYTAAFATLCVGKCLKCKAMSGCPVHS